MFLGVLMVIGLAGIVVGSVAVVRNVRQSRRQLEKKSRGLVVVFATGSILAAGSFLVAYPYGETSVVGFPFPAAVWENHADFVGPLTLPFMCANAWFAFVVPHLIFRLVRRKAA
jgi:hypothetical protein